MNDFKFQLYFYSLLSYSIGAYINCAALKECESIVPSVSFIIYKAGIIASIDCSSYNKLNKNKQLQ